MTEPLARVILQGLLASGETEQGGQLSEVERLALEVVLEQQALTALAEVYRDTGGSYRRAAEGIGETELRASVSVQAEIWEQVAGDLARILGSE